MPASRASNVPPSGVWCPAVTLFDRNTDELLLEDQAKYYAYLSKTGLAGLVVLGTNAETFLLTREERKTLLETARRAVGPDFPIMAGVMGHSTKQVIQYIDDAHDAGADYALVLPPGYFPGASSPAVIEGFFDDVAAESKLPVVLYNFPAVCNGVDLSSATIASIATKHKGKVVGVKLTCGSVAKITRLAAQLPADEFAVFGGQSDFLVGGLSVGSAGCIAAFANVFPRAVARVYDLYQSGKHAEALKLQQLAALAEQPCKAGIAAVKYAASLYSAKAAGVADAAAKMQPRRPYGAFPQAAKDSMQKEFEELAAAEAKF